MNLLEQLWNRPPTKLDGIECPVLIAWGTKDRIIPARRYTARFRELLPKAQWVTWRGAGHCPMDEPELLAGAIADFVRAATPAAARQPA